MRIYRARRRSTRGIATIEVLVAVAIVILIGTIGVISFGTTDKGQVRAEAAATALFLQQSRMRALELGQPVEIVLSATDRALYAGPAQFNFGRGIEVSPPEARLVLDPTGGSEGLTVMLSKGDHSADVTLDWLTGRVVIE